MCVCVCVCRVLVLRFPTCVCRRHCYQKAMAKPGGWAPLCVCVCVCVCVSECLFFFERRLAADGHALFFDCRVGLTRIFALSAFVVPVCHVQRDVCVCVYVCVSVRERACAVRERA